MRILEIRFIHLSVIQIYVFAEKKKKKQCINSRFTKWLPFDAQHQMHFLRMYFLYLN